MGFTQIFSWGAQVFLFSCHIEAGQLWLWRFCEIIFCKNYSLCVVWHTRVQPSLWGMRVLSYPDIMDSDIGGHARMPNYIVRRVGDRHIEIEWKNSLSFYIDGSFIWRMSAMIGFPYRQAVHLLAAHGWSPMGYEPYTHFMVKVFSCL